MRYRIERASDHWLKHPPCADATKGEDGHYYIVIETLADLQALIARVGDLIVGPETIQIYDSWVE